jgi:hypothetical protein
VRTNSETIKVDADEGTVNEDELRVFLYFDFQDNNAL